MIDFVKHFTFPLQVPQFKIRRKKGRIEERVRGGGVGKKNKMKKMGKRKAISKEKEKQNHELSSTRKFRGRKCL